MTSNEKFEIFLVAAPGLEAALRDEALDAGFAGAKPVKGGVVFDGDWPDVWRANLIIRGASHVLVRLVSFRAVHLAKLDKRLRGFDWSQFIKPGTAVRVDATCTRSRIYHSGAVKQRLANVLSETVSAVIDPNADLALKARIDDDLCTISIDSSGDPLHKRGHKQAVGKAPMRENLAALFLRQCGLSGATGQSAPISVIDPMCGSGTLIIEAAEIASGLVPGRSRRFAFEQLVGFDQEAWLGLKHDTIERHQRPQPEGALIGYDRDEGAVRMSIANAERANVNAMTAFKHQPISELRPPMVPPGLIIVNPPYGGRIGNKKPLMPLYSTLGRVLKERFSGWKVGLITNDIALAKACSIDLIPAGATVAHGGLNIRLYQSGELP